MRGTASASSLFRLLLCAAFLCVAWILLSPGEAQAAEAPRPELGVILTGTSAQADAATATAVPTAPRGSAARPATRLVTSVGTTTHSVVRDAVTPVRRAARPPAQIPPKPKAPRPAEVTLQTVRKAVQPVRDAVQPVAGETERVVRETTSGVTSALTSAAGSLPVVQEPVDVVTETVDAVTDAVLDLDVDPVVVPGLPGVPSVPVTPALPETPLTSAPSPGGLPAAGSPADVRGTHARTVISPMKSPAAVALPASRSAAASNLFTAHGSGTSMVHRPFSPVRDGGAQQPVDGPLGTSPSGSSAGPAGGHGTAADGVLSRGNLDARVLMRNSGRGDDTATHGPADRPGSRPD